MTTLAERRQQLERRRSDLQGRLVVIETELDSHQSKDWEDLATEREGDEVLEGMGLTAQQELRQIEAAMVRMAAGDYGYCVTCGEEIQAERLDLLPYTPFCARCAPR
jgi:RNA polymerase-binding transcription factor DksA